MTMRNFLECLFAALILVLSALWAFIIFGAYVRALFDGASYLWHWMFN